MRKCSGVKTDLAFIYLFFFFTCILCLLENVPEGRYLDYHIANADQKDGKLWKGIGLAFGARIPFLVVSTRFCDPSTQWHSLLLVSPSEKWDDLNDLESSFQIQANRSLMHLFLWIFPIVSSLYSVSCFAYANRKDIYVGWFRLYSGF